MSRTRPALRRLALGCTSVLLVCGLSGLPVGAQDPGAGEGDGASLKEQYDEVLGAEADLQRDIDASTLRRQKLLVDIVAANERLAAAEARLAAAQAELDRTQADEARVRRDLAVARQRMERARDALNRQAVAAYVSGGSSGGAPHMLGPLVQSATDVERAGRSISYADAVLDHQRDVVGEYRSARSAVAVKARQATAARAASQRARDAIRSVRDQLAVERIELQVLSDAETRESFVQQVAMQALRTKKIEIEARVIALEKESDGVAQLLAGVQESQPDYTVGSLQLWNPLPGFEPGSPFGMRFHPILHYERLHAGIDFGAPAGAPIQAAGDGLVVVAGPRGGYGNTVVIDHGHGIATLYAHQSALAVEVGDVVAAGDVVGAIGSTGLSTGPHLHFETRVRGVPVNPTNFIDFAAVRPEPPEGG